MSQREPKPQWHPSALWEDDDLLAEGPAPGEQYEQWAGRSHPLDLDWSSFATLVEEAARRDGSATGKARALLAASELLSLEGDMERALELSRESARVAPKITVTALRYRQLLADPEPSEEKRLLEDAMRLGQHEATRLHASLLLAERLRQDGELERSGSVLDHAAHAGHHSLRLSLERLIHRLTLRKSTAGLDVPESLADVAAEIGELMGNRQSTSSSTVLELHRVARAIARGALADAAARLEQAELEGTAARELAAALWTADASSLSRAKKLLRDVLRSAPTRSSVRLLTSLCLRTGDFEALGALLDSSLPEHEAFSDEERLLLRAVAGRPLELSDQRLSAFVQQHGEVWSGLAPSFPLVSDWSKAADSTVEAALGAELARGWEWSAVEPILAQLQVRGQLPQMVTALRFAQALQAGDAASLATHLPFVNERTGVSPDVQALVGMLMQASGDAEGARQAFQACVDGDGRADLRHAALRGLISLLEAEARDVDAQASADGETVDGSSSAQSDARAQRLDLLAREAEREPNQTRKMAALLERLALLPPHQASQAIADLSWPEFSWARYCLGREEATASLGDWLDELARTRAALQLAAEDRTEAARSLRKLHGESPTPSILVALASWLDPSLLRNESLTRDSAWLVALRVWSSALQRSWQEALEAMRQALEASPSEELLLVLFEWEERLGQPQRLAERWLEASKTSDDAFRHYAYDRLSDLDLARGDEASALMWQKTIVEQFPDDLSALLRVEGELLDQGRLDEWSSLKTKTTRTLSEADAVCYRMFAGLEELGRFDVRRALGHFEQLPEPLSKHPLVLRARVTAALESADPSAQSLALNATASDLWAELERWAATDLDQLALVLARARLACVRGDWDSARSLAERASQLRPESFLTLLLAHHVARQDEPLRRAEIVEKLARVANSELHQARFWQAAGGQWLELQDEERARRCLQENLALEPENKSSFELLREILERRSVAQDTEGTASADTQRSNEELRDLLRRRLALALSAEERIELRTRLARVLLVLHCPDEAKEALEQVLAEQPHDPETLRAHAAVCAELGEHQSAERSLVALEQSLDVGPEKIAVLRSLGDLYDRHLQDREKAMDTYEAVLAADPSDRESAKALVKIFAELGLGERATALQTRLIQSAETADDKRRGALVLARLYEQVVRDPGRAAATLERARKAWPLDADVVQATAQLMDRQGEQGARRLLLGRVGKDARRRLESGRLDAGLLDTLGRVALLSQRPSEAEGVGAARAAFLGTAFELPGAGAKALDAALDDELSPHDLPAPLRHLLVKTGPALDAAFPIDLNGLHARPLSEGPLLERARRFCAEAKLPPVELYRSESLGARCLPISSRPPRLVVGPRLEELSAPSRDFILLRALKLMLMGSGALTRSKPEDAWPMLVSLVHLFAPQFRPAQVDARKVAQSKTLIEQGLARVGYDDEVPTLALEAMGAFKHHGSSLASTPRLMAARAALLGVGSVATAVESLAAWDASTLAESGPSRFRWLDGHPEARDLVLYASSERFARARQLAGVATARSAEATGPKQGAAGGAPPPPRRGGPPPRRN